MNGGGKSVNLTLSVYPKTYVGLGFFSSEACALLPLGVMADFQLLVELLCGCLILFLFSFRLACSGCGPLATQTKLLIRMSD